MKKNSIQLVTSAGLIVTLLSCQIVHAAVLAQYSFDTDFSSSDTDPFSTASNVTDGGGFGATGTDA